MEPMSRGRHRAGRIPPRLSRSSRRVTRRPPTAPIRLLTLVGVLIGLVFAVVGWYRSAPALYEPVSSSVPLLGSSVTTADLAQVTKEFGHMPIVRVYYPGLPASNAWTGGIAAANDSAVVVSFKALPKDILSGSDDAVLIHFFDTAPTGHPIYFSYYHEPEDNIANGQFTLADYKAAWARVAQLADAAHNPDLHSTLILMAWDLQKASGRDWKSYLSGGGIISTLGWDAYPVGSTTGANPQPIPPTDFMASAIAASKSVGLPYGFAEFGLSTAAGRPAWLTEVGNYLLTSGALFGTVFDGSPQNPKWQLTDQASQNVWRGFVAQSAVAQSGPGPTPTPTQSTGSPAPSQPAPSASASPTASMPPSAGGSWITGLNLSPSQFTESGNNHTDIGFRIGQAADVTVLVIRSDGTVVRQIARPGHTAGQVLVPYYGYDGSRKRLPAGAYQVLVVASNAAGSAIAEATLTLSAP